MKKRGSTLVLWMFVEVVIGALVASMLLGAGNSWGTGDAVSRAIIAKDIAICISLLQSSTSETHIAYERDVSSFNIMIKGNHVEVLTSDYNSNPASQSFPPSSEVKESTLVKPNSLYIIKNNQGIFITIDEPTQGSLDFCSIPPSIAFPENPRIFIDPIFDDLDSEGIDRLSRTTFSLYRSLNAEFDHADISLVDPTPGKTEKLSSGMMASNNQDANLVIRLVLSEDNVGTLFAGFNPDTDKSSFDRLNFISCNILNSLSSAGSLNISSVSKYFMDNDFQNPQTLTLIIPAGIFPEEQSKSRLFTNELGNTIAGAIIGVYSEDE